ncbi:hypothetical protein ATSB10_15130 [Dyella thiooxydans]|uniref:Uncharacterized protein n=1 Tax=Dyella thiooxydans TaxID=445710 RepID=A0A160N0S9_9GAMM|nr:hypothetical protein ATSB10_15130 [Dyella thiooxydans]
MLRMRLDKDLGSLPRGGDEQVSERTMRSWMEVQLRLLHN